MVDVISTSEEYDSILKNNKSVFVDFYADWCGPCKMVGPLVEKISNEEKDVKFIKVNVDDFGDIAQRYGIMSIPTLLGFKNGALEATVVGFQPEAGLRSIVERIK
ncbi:MAG: thioredoxin [Solobacterium sp.]|nr:thioredoxin [Solobacterium sp.]